MIHGYEMTPEQKDALVEFSWTVLEDGVDEIQWLIRHGLIVNGSPVSRKQADKIVNRMTPGRERKELRNYITTRHLWKLVGWWKNGEANEWLELLWSRYNIRQYLRGLGLK